MRIIIYGFVERLLRPSPVSYDYFELFSKQNKKKKADKPIIHRQERFPPALA